MKGKNQEPRTKNQIPNADDESPQNIVEFFRQVGIDCKIKT
jgi:hypothetical protein